MEKGQLMYDLKVIRRGYRDFGRDPIFQLCLIVLTLIFLTACFLLISSEPVSHWHETTFILERWEVRSTSKGGAVLDIYTTDGRKFVINENDEIIRNQLESGKLYYTVYADDLWHDIIKGLHDGNTKYLDDAVLRRQDQKFIFGSYSVLFASGGLLILINGINIHKCLQKDRRRMKAFQIMKKRK